MTSSRFGAFVSVTWFNLFVAFLGFGFSALLASASTCDGLFAAPIFESPRLVLQEAGAERLSLTSRRIEGKTEELSLVLKSEDGLVVSSTDVTALLARYGNVHRFQEFRMQYSDSFGLPYGYRVEGTPLHARLVLHSFVAMTTSHGVHFFEMKNGQMTNLRSYFVPSGGARLYVRDASVRTPNLRTRTAIRRVPLIEIQDENASTQFFDPYSRQTVEAEDIIGFR